MRIVKEANTRKNEILDAAAVLFAEKGFDDTSVADIIDAVGIAKGTLYHHFKSKEDIMDALIARQAGVVLSAAREAAGDKSIPVKERVIRTVMALHMDTSQLEDKQVMDHLHKPQNALMHQKAKQIIFQNVPPILADIIVDGIAQGLFETPYPLECMEMMLSCLDTILDDDVCRLTKEQRLAKVQAFIYNLERLLGVKTGELAAFKEAFVSGQVS